MKSILVALALSQAAPPKAPTAEEIMKKIESTPQLKDKEKSFEVAASIGRLYFEQGRYTEAVEYYRQAMVKAEPWRTKYVSFLKRVSGKTVPPAATVDCAGTPESAMETLGLKAIALEKSNILGATACAEAALNGLAEVEVKYADARFLTRDVNGAFDSYSKSLETFPANDLARYSRAALIVDTRGDDLKMLEQAKIDFEKVIASVPPHPRFAQATRLLDLTKKAIAAGGVSKLKPEAPAVAARQPGMPPVLTPELVNAFQNTPRTPEMNENFSKLVEDAEEMLAKNKFDEALANYKQVMPFQPENARLRAGMAWTMIQLNRQPMADNVWRVASSNPEAIDQLAKILKEKGNQEAAKGVIERLKQTVPSYSVTTSIP